MAFATRHSLSHKDTKITAAKTAAGDVAGEQGGRDGRGQAPRGRSGRVDVDIDTETGRVQADGRL